MLPDLKSNLTAICLVPAHKAYFLCLTNATKLRNINTMPKNQILLSLKSLGLRNTKLRTELLQALNHPVDAIELTNLFGVNKTSIYREIKALLKKGLITEVEFGDGKKRYELTSLGHHHHLICTGCHSVSDITLENDLEKAEKQIEKEKSFKVMRHNLEFFGLCINCK